MINSYEHQINRIHNYLGYTLQVNTENENNTYSLMEKKKFEILIIEYLKDEEWTNKEITNFVDEFRKIIIHRLVFISEIQEDKVGFVIRSLQEFFAANYYMDADDIQVKNRLKNIASNSYWRNTLLFSIGYLRSKKEHLLDDVYSLCCEMNGVDLDPFEHNHKNYIKLGSWLSLDILSEGIFNDSPKLTNRFSRLLEDLLKVPHFHEHTKFSRLQNRVKENWILDSFLTSINLLELTDSQIQTCIYITVKLLESSESSIRSKAKAYIQNNINYKTLSHIVNNLHDSGFIDKYFYVLYKEALSIYPTSTFNQIIMEGIISKEKTTLKILKSLDSNTDILKQFVENFLLSLFHSFYTPDEVDIVDYLKIINQLSDKKLKAKRGHITEWAFMNLCNQEEEVVFYSTTSVYHVSINRKNKVILDSIKDIALKHNFKYLVDYCEYALNPNYNSLNIFINSFLELPEETQKIISRGEHDWILNLFFNFHNKGKVFNINEISYIEHTANSIVELEAYTFNKTENFIKFKYSNTVSFHNLVLSKKHHLLNELRSYLVNSENRTEDNNNYILYLFLNIYKNSNEEEKLPELDSDIASQILSIIVSGEYHNNNVEYWKRAWLIMFKLNSLKSNFNSIELSNCFSVLDANTTLRYYYESDLLSINNLLSIFNAFLSLKIPNSIIRFVLGVIISSRYISKSRTVDYISIIDFESLSLTKYSNNEDIFCQLLLLLFAPNYIQNNINSMADNFINIFDNIPNSVEVFISTISSIKFKNDYHITLILQLIDLTKVLDRQKDEPYYYYSIKSLSESIPVKL